ncbi:AMP-dependent synthetase/ligase [Pseudanabaena sp. PCC 6802]|uniref:AMP-dependent synthetase/ligase n=1 Tax=Pseudanabaena sp. PCC 6802 TaxID=118173 RepID=UPI000347982B|nr:AMP-binding protein [Pseudanabaena sp. PCC 6802]
MLNLNKIYRSPPNSGEIILGRTLPSLLDEACDRHPNDMAFNQWTGGTWQSLSNQDFRAKVEELALGLHDLGLKQGDRIALMMHSNANFCIADMACLLAGLIDVPIDLTQTLENITFILQHSEAEALIVSNLDLLYQVVPYLWDTPNLKHIIVAEVASDWQQTRSQLLACQTPNDDGSGSNSQVDIPATACLCIPMLLCQGRVDRVCPQLPQCVQALSMEEIQIRGESLRSQVNKQEEMRLALHAQMLATIIYIPSATGQLHGVMLTHENLSANALAAFTGMENLGSGDREIALSFLPLNHVFARSLLYGHINYGHSIYFTTANRVAKHLKEVRPTILATVPLLLEKAYSKLVEHGTGKERGHNRNLWADLVKTAFNWSLRLAKRYQLGQKPQGLYALQLGIADKLLFPHWRAIFGGRLKFLLCGGAALKAETVNQFAAAGIRILQGYGLTESGSVICVNRCEFNQAGTVGVPLAGVEMAIAPDGEILAKAPYITQGFYKNPTATRQILDRDGWLHTGDLGEFTAEGLLRITGCKKHLFKLSTGKYVTPVPLEAQLKQSDLVEQAIAVGSQRKFCAMLIFPNLKNLRDRAWKMGLEVSRSDPSGLEVSIEQLLQHPEIVALYQTLVDAANQSLPPWSTVKRFKLLHATLAAKSDIFTANLAIDRDRVNLAFANEIDDLYGESETETPKITRAIEPTNTYQTIQAPKHPTETQDSLDLSRSSRTSNPSKSANPLVATWVWLRNKKLTTEGVKHV